MIVEKEQGKRNWFVDKTVEPKKITIDIKQLLSHFDIRPSVRGPLSRTAEYINRTLLIF